MCERQTSPETGHEKLPTRALMEANAAAFEATRFLLFARAVARQRPTIVIGNERYGSLFVTEPLRPYFDSMGVVTFSNRVGSTLKAADSSSILPEEFANMVKKGSSTIVVVDGTTNPVHKNCARLPRSLVAYRNWAESHGITVCHFGNVDSQYVYAGIERLLMQKPMGERHELVLANVTTSHEAIEEYPELKGHLPGYFDDPEKSMSGHRVNMPINLNSFNAEKTAQLNLYVATVQDAIFQRIPHWLQKLSAT